MDADPGWGDFHYTLEGDIGQETSVVVQSQFASDAGQYYNQSNSLEDFTSELAEASHDRKADTDDIYAFYDAYDSYGDHSSSSNSIHSDDDDDDESTDGQYNGLRNGDYHHEKTPPGMATCELCGKVGVQHAFYSKTKRFCSMACSRSAAGQKAAAAKRPKSTSVQSPKKQKVETMIKATPKKSASLPSNQSNSKKKSSNETFDWSTYLIDINAEAASVRCFQHSPMADNWEDIAVGMKVEVLNTDCDLPNHVFWIAQVIRIAGYKVLLRYEGFASDNSHDFWSNLLKLEVHPVGWCATIGKPLLPPKSISSRRSNWRTFLVNSLTGAKTLPSDFQDKVVESMKFKFMRGMKLEVVDKMRVSRMRVAMVDDVVGGRLQLQYCDSEGEDDFWCHTNSPLIHPCGWSVFVGHDMKATDDIKEKCISLAKTDKSEEGFAPWELFYNGCEPPKGQSFSVGMKLEAIDPLNLASICVATVMKVLKNNYLMIGIDGSMAVDGSDWFCYHAISPCIFPAGFCELNNIELTPPRGHKGKFKWLDYLIATKSQAAPVKLFNRKIPKHGFKVGHKLEAVDLMEPHLVCVGTVTKVVGRLLRIHFDGWDKMYDQWIDCESPDLYPVGWCQAFNYALEPPKTQDPIPPPPIPVKPRKKKPKNQSYKGSRKKKKQPPQKKPVAGNKYFSGSVSANEPPPYTSLPAKSVAATLPPVESKPAIKKKSDLTTLISSPPSITPPLTANIGNIHVTQEVDQAEKRYHISTEKMDSGERPKQQTQHDNSITSQSSTVTDSSIEELLTQIPSYGQSQTQSNVELTSPSSNLPLPSFSTFAASSRSATTPTDKDNAALLQTDVPNTLQGLSANISVSPSIGQNFNTTVTGYSTSPVGSMQPFPTTMNTLNIPHSVGSNSFYGIPSPGRATVSSPVSSPVSARHMPPLSAICVAQGMNTLSPSVTTMNSMPPLTKRNYNNMPPLSTPLSNLAGMTTTNNNIPVSVSSSGGVQRTQSLPGHMRLPLSTTANVASLQVSPAVFANINMNQAGLTQYKAMQSMTSSLPTLSSSTLTETVLDYDPTEPSRWGVLEVLQFLKENECGAYTESFRKQQIDGKKLLSLTKEQICNLTGMKVGPSLKIHEHIQQLKARLAQQPQQ
ncbi:uncharacterized protein LOC144438584 [Glandiceps talaboti]